MKDRQKLGIILFWAGVVCIFIMQALNWIQQPVQRINTAEDLSGTIYAVDGALFWIRIFGANGLTLALIGVLISTGKKKSFCWLLGFIPGSILTAGMFWQPTLYIPALFGIRN